MLISYATPDKQAYPRHSLSRTALLTSGSPIFFLDAFTTLVVFYSSTADPILPYPPPHDCKSTSSFYLLGLEISTHLLMNGSIWVECRLKSIYHA